MKSLARDATLHHYGSHSVKEGQWTVEGISNEEVFLYFDAIWRGKPVAVTMRADRYAASYHDEHTNTSSDKLTPWRTYASEARYGSVDERGLTVTGNARSALSDICKPLAMEWLNSDDYTKSYQRAVARMIMRHFDNEYFGMERIEESLVKFNTVLPIEIRQAITKALSAYRYYAQFKQQAFDTINKEA